LYRYFLNFSINYAILFTPDELGKFLTKWDEVNKYYPVLLFNINQTEKIWLKIED